MLVRLSFVLFYFSVTNRSAAATALMQCSNATLSDLNALPGYHQLLSSIAKDYGATPHKVEVNSQESHPIARQPEGTGFDDMILEVCFSTGPYTATDDPASSTCDTDATKLSGFYEGTTGVLSVQVVTGYSAAAQLQTSRATTMGGHVKGMVEATQGASGGKMSMTVTVVNTLYSQSKTEVQTTEWITATAYIGDEQRCDMYYNVTSCRHTVSIAIPVSMSGWVQLNFKDKVAYTGNDYHAKYWWVNIEDKAFGLTADDRTTHFVVGGDITLSSKSDVYVICTDGNSPPAVNQTRIPDSPKNPDLNADGHNAPQIPGHVDAGDVSEDLPTTLPITNIPSTNNPITRKRDQFRL